LIEGLGRNDGKELVEACPDLSGNYTASSHKSPIGVVELQQQGCTGRAVGHWTFTVVGNKVTIGGRGVTGIISKTGEKVKVQWSNGIVYEQLITACPDLSGNYTASSHASPIGVVQLQQQGCTGRAGHHWAFTVVGNKVSIDGKGVTGVISKTGEKVKIQWSNGIVYEQLTPTTTPTITPNTTPKACPDLSGKYTASTYTSGNGIVELQQQGCTGRAVGHWTFTVVGNKVTIDGRGVIGVISKTGEKVKIQWSNDIVYEKIITAY